MLSFQAVISVELNERNADLNTQHEDTIQTARTLAGFMSCDCPSVRTSVLEVPINKRVAPLPWVHHWYWTFMLWLIDSCQSKVSADGYHVTISRAQVKSSSRSRVFFYVDRSPDNRFSIGSRAQVKSGESVEEHAKAKFWQNLNSDALLTFFRHIPCTIVFWKVLDILHT